MKGFDVPKKNLNWQRGPRSITLIKFMRRIENETKEKQEIFLQYTSQLRSDDQIRRVSDGQNDFLVIEKM